MLCKSKNTYLGSLVHFLCGLWGRREPLHLGLMVGGLRSLGLLKCQSGDFPVVRTPVSSRDWGLDKRPHSITSYLCTGISCCRHQDPACSFLSLHFLGWIWGPSPTPPPSLPASRSWGESQTSHLPSLMGTAVHLMPVGFHGLRWLPSQRRIEEGLGKGKSHK